MNPRISTRPKTYRCHRCGRDFNSSGCRENAKFCSQFCYHTSHRITPEQFWSKVKIGNSNECWPWMGWVERTGYGRVGYHGNRYGAHQVAFLLTRGRKPPRPRQVCHKCDNRICCNPTHLFEGTAKQNQQDCAAKGRVYRQLGELHWKSKLTKLDILRIRSVKRVRGIVTSLARKYGVNYVTISDVLRRRTWRHV